MEFTFNARVTDQWLVMGGFSDTDARNDITGVAKDLSPRLIASRCSIATTSQRAHSRISACSLGTIYTASDC